MLKLMEPSHRILNLASRLAAALPDAWASRLCQALSPCLLLVLRRRHRAMRRNLFHCFPELTEAERRKLARTSVARTLELAWWVLASPSFSKDELARRLRISDPFRTWLQERATAPEPIVALTPHLALSEALTTLPALPAGKKLPPTGVIYRPLNQKTLEHWVRQTRQRHGIHLLSRREGFARARQLLRQNGMVGVLFDQNAGRRGVLTTSFGRLISVTELPGLLAVKHQARMAMIYVRRTGFGQGVFEVEELPRPQSPTDAVLHAEQWLEDYLRTHPEARPDWLWLHQRWKAQRRPRELFRIEAKRNALAQTAAFHGCKAMPRSTSCWIRLPDTTGEAELAAPWLHKLQDSRPDFALTLLGTGAVCQAAKQTLGELPVRLLEKANWAAWRMEYPDVLVVLPMAKPCALEARKLQADLSLGWNSGPLSRKVFAASCPIKNAAAGETLDDRHLEAFFRYFGLQTSAATTS